MRRITLLTNPDKCNLRCALCFLRQRGIVSYSGEMPFETAKAAIEKYAAERDEAGNLLLKEVIPSTMGEPLLYSKFENLLHLCEMTGVKMNLTTNGTFPGKWGTPSVMFELVQACSDIKISTLAYEMGGFLRNLWRENVEKLIECRKRRIKKLKVVYSEEVPTRPIEDMSISCRTHCICPPGAQHKCTERRDIPGSTAFVPSVVGLIIAGEVVKDLCRQ